MGIFQVVYLGLLVVVARSQELQNCSVGTSPFPVGSTEDAAALATSLECSNGDFAVEWVGEVFVEETIFVTDGTSLHIAGAGRGAVADGGGSTQLFYVEGGSSLHVSDMTLSNGNTSFNGGAIFANQSVVSFSGNASFISNYAGEDGGAIFAFQSIVSWDGDGTQFSNNSAGYGGAIFADESTVSWDGDGTQFSSNSADREGGAIYARQSNVSWDGDGTQFSSNSADRDGGEFHFSVFGGAICAFESIVSWDGDGTQFSSNSAGSTQFTSSTSSTSSTYGDDAAGQLIDGGAIYAYESIVSWDGDGTQFTNNSAGDDGGAINAYESNVSWDGDGTQFSFNSAGQIGGAIYEYESNVSWVGDGTQFSSNSAGDIGGAISENESNVSWDGDGTQFSSNSADRDGGAIWAWKSNVSWDGDGTQFTSNSAGDDGGAINADESNVSWDGDGTQFSFNSAGDTGGAIYEYESNVSWVGDGTQFTSNSAGDDGGAIYARESNVSWVGNGTHFSSNSATNASGGAIFLSGSGLSNSREEPETGSPIGWDSCDDLKVVDLLWMPPSSNTTFVSNSAKNGGALYSEISSDSSYLIDVTFHGNSASETGGAVELIYHRFVYFVNCTFSENVAGEGAGAVETVLGEHHFHLCNFEGNLAEDGGAMRLGSDAAEVSGCSFVSNFAQTEGFAVSVPGCADIRNASFDGNQLSCATGLYRSDTNQEDPSARFEAVCVDCPPWGECAGCTIGKGDVTSTCEAPLEHTTAREPGLTLETLNIDGGYWRTTTESDNILACHNPDACRGGLTGADSFCASGYKGPYCAVCEADYSPSLAHTCTRCSSSRRQGLVAATVIAALAAALAVVTIFRFLVSADVEEGNIGWFHRRVLRAVPVQAVKIIVVVWQILTQFADAANVTYPGVYQDFLSAINIVNFDIGSVLAAGCLWSGIDFHARLLVSTIGPLVVAGFLAMTYLIAMRRQGASSDAAAVEKIRHKHQTALLLVTFLVYSSVSSMVFQTFACETLDDDIEYLRADYRIHCTDAKHKAFEVYAGIMASVYPVGIPLLYTALLFQHSDVLANADADKTVAQPIAGLWDSYRPERFYYEIVECGRRIMLTGVVVFIFPNDAAQIAITMLIAFFFFAVFEVLSPYKSESDTWLSRGGHVIVFLSMFDLLLLKVDVSGERDQSQAAFAGVLV
ncbi:unnamed protein product, partial [Ectocarpus sp. 12 AP-2014]